MAASALVSIAACGSTEPNRDGAFEIVYHGPPTSTAGAFIAIDRTGANKRVLAAPSDGFFCPALSPDGTRVVYGDIATNQIILFDLTTGVEKQLTQGTLWSQCPTWSPDGTQIAFFRGPSTAPNGFGLYVMGVDGSFIRELAADGFSWGGIDWSPDGRMLAVSDFAQRLVLVDRASGSIVRTLTSNGAVPAFSPDGREIAYLVPGGNTVDIWISNVDGSNQHAIKTSVNGPGYPRWSPDGNYLAYWSYVAGQTPPALASAIFLMSRDGASVPWKNGETIYGDYPMWRRIP